MRWSRCTARTVNRSSSEARPPVIRAVFLDAGGTLVYLDRRFILQCLADAGFPRTEPQFLAADADVRRRLGEIVRERPDLDDEARWQLYGPLLMERLECSGAAVQEVVERVVARHRADRLWTHTAEGTLEALERVRAAGYTLGVVSNANGRVERFLEHAGITQHLDFVIDSGLVGVEKPDPRIFRIACERAGVAPHEAVHVGDIYEIDVVGARAHGVRPLLLDPESLHADADCERIASMAELPAWLEQAARG
jgi:putative hydrolase of the HAD superfamily